MYVLPGLLEPEILGYIYENLLTSTCIHSRLVPLQGICGFCHVPATAVVCVTAMYK